MNQLITRSPHRQARARPRGERAGKHKFLIAMPVALPGFFSSPSFSGKSPPNPASDRRQETLDRQGQATDKGKELRSGSIVTIPKGFTTKTVDNMPTAPAAPGPVILMRGLLEKRTTGKVSARWVARTVVIEGAPSHMLCYYDAAEKGKPKNVLRLSELTSRRKENKDCVFLAITAPRTYEFRASSAAEAAEWVACITAAAGRASSEWQETVRRSSGISPPSMSGDRPNPPPMGDSRPSPPSAPPKTRTARRSVFSRGMSAVLDFSPRKSFSSKRVERIPAPENERSSEWEDVLPSTSNPGLEWDGGSAFDEALSEAEML